MIEATIFCMPLTYHSCHPLHMAFQPMEDTSNPYPTQPVIPWPSHSHPRHSSNPYPLTHCVILNIVCACLWVQGAPGTPRQSQKWTQIRNFFCFLPDIPSLCPRRRVLKNQISCTQARGNPCCSSSRGAVKWDGHMYQFQTLQGTYHHVSSYTCHRIHCDEWGR